MRRKKSSSGIIILMFFIILSAGMAYVYNATLFERNAPKIELESVINWNLKQPIKLLIKDESGIKFYRTTLSDGKNSIVLEKKFLKLHQKKFLLKLLFLEQVLLGIKQILSL